MILFVVLLLVTSIYLNNMVVSPFHDLLTLDVIYWLPVMKAEKFIFQYQYFCYFAISGWYYSVIFEL